MEILSLNLKNYRGFLSKKIILDPKLTVIVGANGSGKSNILEAILYLSGIRPQKAETDLDLVRFGASDAKIEGKVGNGDFHNLTINFQIFDERNIKKSYFVDELKKRLLEFVDIFSVVLFEPADLDLVSGSPSLRRKFLDRFLSSHDREYWRNISAYNKVVVRRNRILQRIQEGKSRSLELNFWDERLLSHAKYISKKRAEFFEFLNFVEKAPLRSKSTDKKGSKEYSWQLKQSLVSEEKLKDNRERDIAAGVTLSGPHRDDFRFIFGGRDLEFFGSRGEQRMAVLALKMAELEYFRIHHEVRPVLALDDIFSELDWEHRAAVVEACQNQQTIITAAEEESVPKEIFKKAKIIKI